MLSVEHLPARLHVSERTPCSSTAQEEPKRDDEERKHLQHIHLWNWAQASPIKPLQHHVWFDARTVPTPNTYCLHTTQCYSEMLVPVDFRK